MESLQLLILDHPLRGLNPGTRRTVNEPDPGHPVAARGDPVADTLEEALDVGDDILVMRDGEVTAHFDLSSGRYPRRPLTCSKRWCDDP